MGGTEVGRTETYSVPEFHGFTVPELPVAVLKPPCHRTTSGYASSQMLVRPLSCIIQPRPDPKMPVPRFCLYRLQPRDCSAGLRFFGF